MHAKNEEAILNHHRMISDVHNNNKNRQKAADILPNRLISVFGLEASGTTFLATTLARAIGGFNQDQNVTLRWTTRNVEIQHISEPWGYVHSGNAERNNQLPPIINVVLPEECMLTPHEDVETMAKWHSKRSDAKSICERLGVNPSPQTYPKRFFVNVTSQILWYRQRGVDATAVILVRDDSARTRGMFQKTHVANNVTAVRQQYNVGKNILAQALQQLQDKTQVLLVSYETLMVLQEVYLFKIYQDLGIRSTYIPEFKDGNAKYMRNHSTSIEKA